MQRAAYGSLFIWGVTTIAQRDVTIRISATDNFSQVMQKYNTEMDKAEKNTKDLGRSSSDLSNTIKGLFTIAVAQQIAGVATEMVNLGVQANATEDRFRALTSTMGGYEETMAGLRKATLGTVDDMAMQQGAMLLIQTAGIETNAELERMMNLITMTKKPSEDMTTAIQNFGLMLANNSILRLDSFGISASKVRARIEELKEELGVDRSEAFRMAVMEEGEKNIRKFGDAADAASTSLSRLGVVITNEFQDWAQKAATGAQGFGLAIEFMLGLTPQQQAHQQQMAHEAAISLALDLQDAFDAAMSDGAFGMNPQVIGTFVSNALEMAAKDPSLMNDMDGFMNQIFGRMGESVPSEYLQVFRDILENSLQIQAANQSERDIAIEIADQQKAIADQRQRIHDIVESENALYVDQQKYIDEVRRKSQEAADAAQFALDRKNVILSTYMSALGTTGGDAMGAGFRYQSQLYEDSNSRGMLPEYLTQGQAGEIQAAAEQARMLADNMAAAAEAEEGLFSDEEVERVSAYASNLEDMADEAEKAAEAFENMSLAEMFNQTDGGRVGEMFDVIIDKMKEAGAETWELNNAQRALDLRSGELTTSAAAFQDQIAPHLAQLMFSGQENLVNEITREYEELMMGAQLRGINVDSPNFVSQATSTFTNPLFNPREFDSEAFLAGFQPAADAAGTLSADSTTATDNFNLMSEKTPLIAADVGAMEVSMGAMVGHTDKVKEAIEGLSKTKVTIPVQFEWLNLGGLVSLIMPGLIQAVQSAGGIMPGTDQRASQSGTLVRQGNAF